MSLLYHQRILLALVSICLYWRVSAFRPMDFRAVVPSHAFRVKSSPLTTSFKIYMDAREGNLMGRSVFVDKIFSELAQPVNSARATLLFVSMLYGTNFGCVKILGDALDPSFASLVRFTLAGSVFLPYLVKNLSEKPTLVRGGMEVGAYAAVGYWGQAIALESTKASTAAFICSLAVLVVPLLDIVFQKKGNDVIGFNKMLPALLAAFGVACLELGGDDIPGLGDLFAFIQPVFFGLAFWRTEKFMSKDIVDADDPKIFTGAMLFSVAISSLVWSSHDFFFPGISAGYTIEELLKTQLAAFSDWRIVASLIWTGIVTTALTSFGENLAMRKLSAAESTVIYSTEPLWGALFASLVLGEHLGWNTAIGALLIMSGCLLSSLGVETVGTYVLGLLAYAQQSVVSDGVSDVFKNLLDNVEKIFSER